MSHVTEQPRRPAGAAGAGEWVNDPSIERPAPVDLGELSDEEYNADGTFEFPPIPRSAEQHLKFWMRVEVPEGVLRQVRDLYNTYRQEEVESVVRGARKAWENRKQRKEIIAKGWPTEEAYVSALEENTRERAPMTISRFDIRALVRAECAYMLSGPLPEDQQLIADNHEFYLDCDKGNISIKEARLRYGLNRFKWAFKDPSLDVPDSMRAMNENISELIRVTRVVGENSMRTNDAMYYGK